MSGGLGGLRIPHSFAGWAPHGLQGPKGAAIPFSLSTHSLILLHTHCHTDLRVQSHPQMQVAEYKSMFGEEAARDMLAAAPQLLTMACESVRVRHELLQQLARSQQLWATQLDEAGPSMLGVWLTSRCAGFACAFSRTSIGGVVDGSDATT